MITLATLLASASAAELNMQLYVEVDGKRAPLQQMVIERTNDSTGAVMVLRGKEDA